nr:integrase, catalytic region, zinc finger, CCHC-type, peptidase aspartic, catalytic [Tanacetum cinerariifolium]
MDNLSEDIQCAGSDIRPPMLDRTDFASWQQRIRLYYRDKENEVNILNSIDEGPFRMGTLRETLTEGLPKDIYSLINHYTDAKDIWDNVKMLLEGSELPKEDRESQLTGNNAWGVGAASYGRSSEQSWENGVALDKEQLLFIAGGQDNIVDEDVDEQLVSDLALNVDNMFQANDGDAFDSDVDEAPTAQTCSWKTYHPHILFIMKLPTQHVFITTQNNVVDKSLTAELATYKEQVELYERRAIFEQTEREQKIDEQLRIVITGRNIKEENFKKELHSIKMQLASTINHNKSMVEEVTSLKKDFKQKENKYLKEFFDMKALKEKYKVAIGYKNPLCLTRAKQFQPALYNGHEIIKTDHVPAIVHNSEDTLEIAEITRKKITNNKINIKPPDYSKENFLATFTPQTQLTPEQIFWSKDVLKMKTEALAEQAKAAKPVRDLTVYPPNTPVKLVPRVLPT